MAGLAFQPSLLEQAIARVQKGTQLSRTSPSLLNVCSHLTPAGFSTARLGTVSSPLSVRTNLTSAAAGELMYLMTDCTRHSRYWVLKDTSATTPIRTFARLSSVDEFKDIAILGYVTCVAWILTAAGQQPPTGAEDRLPGSTEVSRLVADGLPGLIHKYATEVSLGARLVCHSITSHVHHVLVAPAHSMHSLPGCAC